MIMSKNDDYISNLSTYITEITNTKSEIRPLTIREKNKIPLTVTGVYDLLGGEIMGIGVTFALEKDSNQQTPAQIGKQMNVIQRVTRQYAVYVAKYMLPYNVKRLTSHHVNFIIPGKQMFIPSLLIDIKKPVTSGVDLTNNISPFTQVFLLCHLEKERMDGLTAKDISRKFAVSYATANRTVRWLTEKGLSETNGSRENRITFTLHGKELWKKSLPYLVTPILKTIKTNTKFDNGLVSGVMALSEFTMLNPSQNRCYAIGRDTFNSIDKQKLDQYGDDIVEVWKYDPNLLGENGVVDKLSLYLSLKDNQDERIQIELEHLIDNVTWLEA